MLSGYDVVLPEHEAVMAKRTNAELAADFKTAHEVDGKTVHRRWHIQEERERFFLAVPGEENELSGQDFRKLLKDWLKKSNIAKSDPQISNILYEILNSSPRLGPYAINKENPMPKPKPPKKK